MCLFSYSHIYWTYFFWPSCISESRVPRVEDHCWGFPLFILNPPITGESFFPVHILYTNCTKNGTKKFPFFFFTSQAAKASLDAENVQVWCAHTAPLGWREPSDDMQIKSPAQGGILIAGWLLLLSTTCWSGPQQALFKRFAPCRRKEGYYF